MTKVHPALFFLLGAFIIPLVGKKKFIRDLWLLSVPVMSFLSLLPLREGEFWAIQFFSYHLLPLKADRLSLVFAYVFVIAAFTSIVYSLHVKKTGEHVAAFIYVGGALGVTFAGDWITLLMSWELMAISSVFLIWYRRTRTSLAAGFRYLMVHLTGGTLLFAGIVIYLGAGGNLAIAPIPCHEWSAYFMITGFILNAAVPPLHAWLTDAYPEATITGSVFLSAFTTKSAVYILLRVFPGAEILVWLGAIMAVYGIVYATLENDIRRLLSYHIVSQVGYMVCGVGLGTALSMNGAAAHAFCHILYKALLFMGVGVVIEATGKNKLTDLQGKNLYESLPAAFYLYMIGAFSISGVPLFSGFVSKNMIVSAAGEIHKPIVHTLLHLASIGTFLSTALKLPYGSWFGQAWRNKKEPGEIKIKRVSSNMIVAMVMNAFLCLGIGIYPDALYRLLPYEAPFQPYSLYTVVTTVQLLVFTGIGFWLFFSKLAGEPSITLDTDWIYRRGAIYFYRLCHLTGIARSKLQTIVSEVVNSTLTFLKNPFAPLPLGDRKRGKIAYYDPDVYRPAIGIAIFCFMGLFSLFFILFAFLY